MMAHRLVTLTCVLGLAAATEAQRTSLEEMAKLEPVLARAMTRVAPSVVIVETFGGTRRSLVASGGPSDGAAAPEPKPAPEKPADEDGEKKGEEKKDDEDEPLGPLVQPGFLQAQGATTGVVLTADGWILISRFALNFDPSTILITLPDGRSFHGRRAGEDTSRGFALVKIDATDLPVPEFADPNEAAVGQWAFVLGRTFGRAQPSVHMGILSAKGRLFGRALQTDAYTSPANYGGPLIDLRGRVLGISVPLSRSGRDAGVDIYDSGIGFAATVHGLDPLFERMKAGETLHRGFLGVGTAPDEFGPGARITRIEPGSSAEAVGLQRGDVLLEIDGVSLANSFHLQSLVSSKMGGEPVHVRVARDDGTIGVTVILSDLPEAEREPVKPSEEAGELPWEEGDKAPSDR